MASRITDEKSAESALYQRDYQQGYDAGYEAARCGELRKYNYFLSLSNTPGNGAMDISPYMQGYFQGFGSYRAGDRPQ